VQLHEHSQVVEVQRRSIVTSDGVLHAADEVLWCTQAAPPDWLRQTGLPVGASSKQGCVRAPLI
jgi:NADH dehydrogenase FAD-containing subunit